MQETSGLQTLGESAPTKVKVDGEEAVLHITDQSVMFEKGGRVGGFERSAIRMVKPDGDAMIIAYSAGSEVKSVRVEPMTAVASLLLSNSGSTSGRVQTSMTGVDEIFEKLYGDARKELEEELARVEAEPQNKSLRLNPTEEDRYSQVARQMEGIVSAKYRIDLRAEGNPISFWGLEKQPYELQLDVVKIHHVRFLRMIVGPRAETADRIFTTDEVWPDDWPRILEHFNLGNDMYTSEMFTRYINYLKPHWKYQPDERKPVLARS